MKYLKKYNAFLNEGKSESKIDDILSIQDSIHTNDHHSYTKEDLCNMSEEELDNVILDLKSIKASVGEEDTNFMQDPYNPNIPSEVASGRIKQGL